MKGRVGPPETLGAAEVGQAGVDAHAGPGPDQEGVGGGDCISCLLVSRFQVHHYCTQGTISYDELKGSASESTALFRRRQGPNIFPRVRWVVTALKDPGGFLLRPL